MKLDYISQRKEFETVWERRHQQPQVLESWTDNNWAKDRTEYLTFLVSINDQTIQEKTIKVQDQLSQYRCIDTLPVEYLHITIKETGCFIVDEKTRFDEATRQEVMNIAVEAKKIIKEYNPFTIQLKRLNNFSSVICVEVYDGGIIRNINKKLRNINGVNTLPHDPGFLPHMSIAQFQSDQDYEGLIKTLEEKRETCIGKLIIDHIELVVAHLPKNNRYPQLEVITELPLCRN
ncbi:hypothetical protein GF326_09390 [Candidatus Bathyarchaeota archaeon]|nr:hypothetical protein [Candidatus Bathyarchaeota archaeon]